LKLNTKSIMHEKLDVNGETDMLICWQK